MVMSGSALFERASASDMKNWEGETEHGEGDDIDNKDKTKELMEN